MRDQDPDYYSANLMPALPKVNPDRSLGYQGFMEFWRDLSVAEYSVYQMFGDNDELLYVGVSCQVRSRIRDHFAEKPWVRTDVRRIEVHNGMSEEEAITQERTLIRERRPRHNVLAPDPMIHKLRARK